MAHCYPGSSEFDELIAIARETHSRIVEYEDKIWKLCRDDEGPFFVSIDCAPVCQNCDCDYS